MRVKSIQAGDVETRVHIWGNGKRPRIVCLHGLGGTGLSFIEIAELMRSNYDVIAITIPGSGGTPAFATQQHYTMDELVGWLDSVVLALGLERFNIVGHSWGGQIALFYLAQRGEKVEKCVLIDGGYYRRSAVPCEFDEIHEEIDDVTKADNEYRFGSVEEYLAAERQDAKYWSLAKEAAALDRIIRKGSEVCWHLSSTVTAWSLLGIYQDEPYSVYESIRVQGLGSKLLLLQATMPQERKDRVGLSREFSEGTDGQVLRMSECGHSMHIESPERVSAEIVTFLSQR